MRRFAALLLIVTLCVAVTGTDVEARRRRHDAAVPGAFDYYLLTLSIAPSFCALSDRNQAKTECQELTKPEFDQTPLTVHGLWPNRARVSVNMQPQDCAGPDFGELSHETEQALLHFMPGGLGLARYEWRKHGTCSGLSPERYFSAVVDLAKHANATIGAVMQRHNMLAGSVRVDALLDAIAQDNPAVAAAIVVDCKYPRGGGRALIDEIRVVLSKEFVPVAARSVGLGQNSGCPSGVGFVPGVMNE
jgi:ribonuclease T2